MAVARPITGTFIGSIAGLGTVFLNIPLMPDDSDDRGSLVMRSDSGEIGFDIQNRHEGVDILTDSLGIMRCRLSDSGDSLYGSWSPQEGTAGIPFLLLKVAEYRKFRRAIPVPVRYEASVKGRGAFTILTDGSLAFAGFGRWEDDTISTNEGSITPDGNVLFPDPSYPHGVFFTGRMREQGRRISGIARMMDRRELHLQLRRKKIRARYNPSEIEPLTVIIPSFPRLGKEMTDTITGVINRMVDNRYRWDLELVWFSSASSAQVTSISAQVNVEYYSNDIVSTSIWTEGYDSDETLFDSDSLASFGLVGGHPRLLTLPILFKPGIPYSERLNALLITQARNDSAVGSSGLDTTSSLLDACSWCVVRNGLEFTIRQYMAQIPTRFTIPFAELRDLIDPDGPLRQFVRKDR